MNEERNRETTCTILGNQGFTLPELLVVLCLVSLLSSFLLQGYITIAMQQRKQLELLELKDNISIAMAYITEDIGKSTAVLDCTAEQLTLRQNKIIYYTLGSDQQSEEHLYQLEGKVLYRRENTQWNRQPMANFIAALDLEYLDAQGQATTDPQAVATIVLSVEGHWQGTTIRQSQMIGLVGPVYL